jgi:hypothetical protein
LCDIFRLKHVHLKGTVVVFLRQHELSRCRNAKFWLFRCLLFFHFFFFEERNLIISRLWGRHQVLGFNLKVSGSKVAWCRRLLTETAYSGPVDPVRGTPDGVSLDCASVRRSCREAARSEIVREMLVKEQSARKVRPFAYICSTTVIIITIIFCAKYRLLKYWLYHV